MNSEFTPYAVHVSTILMFNTKYFVDIGTISVQRADSELLQKFWFGFNVRDSKKFHNFLSSIGISFPQYGMGSNM